MNLLATGHKANGQPQEKYDESTQMFPRTSCSTPPMRLPDTERFDLFGVTIDNLTMERRCGTSADAAWGRETSLCLRQCRLPQSCRPQSCLCPCPVAPVPGVCRWLRRCSCCAPERCASCRATSTARTCFRCCAQEAANLGLRIFLLGGARRGCATRRPPTCGRQYPPALHLRHPPRILQRRRNRQM